MISITARRIRDRIFVSIAAVALVAVLPCGSLEKSRTIGVAEANTALSGLADNGRVYPATQVSAACDPRDRAFHFPVSPLPSDLGRNPFPTSNRYAMEGLNVLTTDVQEPSRRFLLADKIETRDKIEYFTDPDTQRTFEEAQRHEIEKEERAWRMLDNMQIYHLPREKSHRSPNETRQQ